MSVNRLGGFEFVMFHNPHDRGAPPIVPAMAADLIQRPGVDGSSVLRLGVKGQPFQMQSGVDVASFAEATARMVDYQRTQNDQPLGIVWNDVDFQFQTVYLPIDVQPIRIRRITASAGGLLDSAGQAWLEAMWTLLPIRTEAG